MTERDEIVIHTCANCGIEFEQPRWQFEIDMEEEGDNYEPCCPNCSMADEL